MAHSLTGPQPTAQLPVAHLDRRFQAFVIDRILSWSLPVIAGVIAWLVAGAELLPIVLAVSITAVLVWAVLAIILGVSGTSPGKSLTGLRVVHTATGVPIGVGPALLRALVLGMGGVPTFGLGVATLAWTAVEDHTGQRRGWHDHLAGSVVVDVRPAPVLAATGADEGPRHIVNLTAMRLIPAPAVEAPSVPPRSPEQSMRRKPMSAQAPVAAPTPAPAPAQPPDAAPSPPAPAPQTAPTSAPTPPPPTHRHVWRVEFDHGESFGVEGIVLVGRRPEPRGGEQVWRLVALPSPDMSVSKTHAQLGPAPDGALVVMDRGSTNGTSVVRKGVVRQLTPGRPTTLIEGDMVVFGDRQMRVVGQA